MSGPLAGVRVVDLSRVLAGPTCTQVLADLGAEIIKIERPGSGDDTRSWGPPWVKTADGKQSDTSAYFVSCNRGKRSIELDITAPEGQAKVRELLQDADILVENFKVGGLAKYGLDYNSLAADFPKLVYCSITGFGQDGPYAHQPGYDAMIQAASGLMSITGEPGRPPQKVGVAVTDLTTGLYAVIGILGALRHAEATGEGQHIDVALMDTAVSMLYNQAIGYLATGESPERMGGAHPSIVPYQPFETADSWIMLAVGNDRQFTAFSEALGQSWHDDARFATNSARVENRDDLLPKISEILKRESKAVWLERLAGAGVPAGPINSIGEAFDHPQVKHRGLAYQVTRQDGLTLPQLRSPIRYSKTKLQSKLPPPQLGQDNDEF